jgi:hypothetical protein
MRVKPKPLETKLLGLKSCGLQQHTQKDMMNVNLTELLVYVTVFSNG